MEWQVGLISHPGTHPDRPPPGPGPSGKPPQTLFVRLAELLWLLRNPLGAAETWLVAQTPLAPGVLAAMAARQDALCGTAATRGEPWSGCQNCGQRPWPLASQPQPGTQLRPAQRLFYLAGPPNVSTWEIA